MALEGLLTYREPLGPIDQANVRFEADADAILNARVAPFSEALSRLPILLLGRRGSGKSSILAEFRMTARRSGRQDRAASSDAPPDIGEPFLITITSWEHFHQLTRHVAAQYYGDAHPQFDSEMVPTEYLSRLWQEAIWDEVILHFYNFCHHREVRPALAAVERYVLADGRRHPGPPHEAARNLYKAAKSAVLAYAAARRSQIILFVDSMEKYPVRNVVFAEVLGGLLQAINAVHYDSELVRITFCLPEEIESHLQVGSANIMKDYNAAYRIRWKPIDLLKVAAHRYRLFAELRSKPLFEATKGLDLDTREGIHEFFNLVMPSDFRNRMGDAEDPLAYIVRHTQLLPRHIIAIFNAIIAKAHAHDGNEYRLTEDDILGGVSDAERLISQQVLVPFYKIYPNLLSSCEDILPDLAPICSFNDLRRIERRFNRRVEEDIGNVWRTLFGMGILGKVVSGDDTEPPAFIRGHRYCLANFHYNIEGAFSLSSRDEYCFHPVFSRHFGLSRDRVGDRRAVYPANVDFITLR